MGVSERLQHVGLMPANNQLGIKEQLERGMKRSYYYLGRKCPEYAILRVGGKGEEEWLTPSAACKIYELKILFATTFRQTPRARRGIDPQALESVLQ